MTDHGDQIAVLGCGDLFAEDKGLAFLIDATEVLAVTRIGRFHLNKIFNIKKIKIILHKLYLEMTGCSVEVCYSSSYLEGPTYLE